MNSEFQGLPLETQEAVKRTMDTMEPAQTPAEIRETLEGTQKGGVKNSIRNCLTVFQRDPLFRGALRLNLLTEQIDIVKPLGWERTSTTLTDMDMNYLLLYLEENYGLTSEKKVQSAIKIVANENRYHPVRDYLNSLQWDGTERIRYALHHFLGADTDEYTYEALKLFLMGAIRRIFRPGSKFEVMLCLVGGQGAGKSTFFRLLAGRDEWFSDDLKKLDDENVYRKLQGHWIIEMSEMIATANAKSIEEIKSFLSRQKETYKVPYETHPAVVLMIICLTILSLQQLLDAGQYKYRFSVLRKLGVEENHIEKLILKQLSVWFGLPIITAVVVAAMVIIYLI